MPSCSIGFWVARQKNGLGSSYFLPAAVTCRSSSASISAAWVLGGVRLISSASTMLAKIGPFWKMNARSPVAGSCPITVVPVMSDGIRSGVNWIRRKSSESSWAIVSISSVLARPGTPTSSVCPCASTAQSRFSIGSSRPTMALPSSLRSALKRSPARSTIRISSLERGCVIGP